MKPLGVIIFAIPAFLAGQDGHPTEQLLAKHYEALGGHAQLAQIKATRASIEIEFGEAQGPMAPARGAGLLEAMLPGSLRMEQELGGQKQITLVNQQGGWRLHPVAQQLPDADFDLAMALANVFESPLANMDEKGFAAKDGGVADDGRTHRIHVTTKKGSEFFVYLDSATYLVARVESGKEAGNIDQVARFSNYRTVEGVNFPHRVELSNPSNPRAGAAMILEKLEINPKLDESRFHPPQTSPPQPGQTRVPIL